MTDLEVGRQALLNILSQAGLNNPHSTGSYAGFVAFFDLPEDLNEKQMAQIAEKVRKAIDGIEIHALPNVNSYYVYFNNYGSVPSYGSLGLIFEEFPGSRKSKQFKYLQNKGMVNLSYKPLEPYMKDDERYTKCKGSNSVIG